MSSGLSLTTTPSYCKQPIPLNIRRRQFEDSFKFVQYTAWSFPNEHLQRDVQIVAAAAYCKG